jgi:hypothetical protein
VTCVQERSAPSAVSAAARMPATRGSAAAEGTRSREAMRRSTARTRSGETAGRAAGAGSGGTAAKALSRRVVAAAAVVSSRRTAAGHASAGPRRGSESSRGRLRRASRVSARPVSIIEPLPSAARIGAAIRRRRAALPSRTVVEAARSVRRERVLRCASALVEGAARVAVIE